MIPKQNLSRAFHKAISQPRYAVRNLNHRLKSTASYRLFNGWSYWPETISLFLTFACNLRCKMCGQWGEDGVFKDYNSDLLRERLSLQEIQKLIDDVKHFNPNITLFGGEPLLYPNWTKVVEIVKSAGLRCNIVTNGVLLNRWAEEIVDLELDEIIFSLDGPEEIHDDIRGVKGTFRKAIDSFININNLKHQKNKKRPLISINTVLTEQTYRYLDEIAEIAEQIDTDVLTFHHLLFLDSQNVNNFIDFFNGEFDQTPSDWLGFVVNKIPDFDIDQLLSNIKSIKSRKSTVDITFYPNFRDDEIKEWYSQFPFQSCSYKNRCMSLWMTAYIFPDGSVRPYHTMNFTPGNIKNSSFKEIWNNQIYKKYRSYIKKHKKFDICSKGCTEFFRY